MSARPPRTYVTDALTRALRVASWVPVAAAVWLVVTRYPAMPDVIPTHFDFDGRPDGWGPKATVLGVFALMFCLQVALDVLSRYPRIYNYPSPVTATNAQAVYREGERMMVALEFGMAPLILGLVMSMIDPASAGMSLVWAGLAITLLACVVGIVRCVQAART